MFQSHCNLANLGHSIYWLRTPRRLAIISHICHIGSAASDDSDDALVSEYALWSYCEQEKDEVLQDHFHCHFLLGIIPSWMFPLLRAMPVVCLVGNGKHVSLFGAGSSNEDLRFLLWLRLDFGQLRRFLFIGHCELRRLRELALWSLRKL